MATLVVETTDVKEAIAQEEALPPGNYGVTLDLISALSQDQLDDLYGHLVNSGVHLLGPIEQRLKGLWRVTIKYRKHPAGSNIGVAWGVVPLLPTFLVAALVGLGIFTLPEIARSFTPIILGLGALTVASLYIVSRYGMPEVRRK